MYVSIMCTYISLKAEKEEAKIIHYCVGMEFLHLFKNILYCKYCVLLTDY